MGVPETKTILIDLDDVLTNMLDTWVDWLNHFNKLDVKVEDIKQWDMSIAFSTLTQEQIYFPLQQREFWQCVCTRSDAREYVKRLFDEGYNIYIVTSTRPHLMQYKMSYCIEPFFPYIDYEHIITCYNKQMIKGDVLVDDYPNNLIDGDYEKILFSRSHNENQADSSLFHIARDWEEVYKIIHKILD